MAEMPATVSNTTVVATVSTSVTLATVGADGVVCVDWAETEKQAKGSDLYLAPLAKLMLSIRDRTYKNR